MHKIEAEVMNIIVVTKINILLVGLRIADVMRPDGILHTSPASTNVHARAPLKKQSITMYKNIYGLVAAYHCTTIISTYGKVGLRHGRILS